MLELKFFTNKPLRMKSIILLLPLIFLFPSCYQDVIDIDLSDINIQVIIVGRVAVGSIEGQPYSNMVSISLPSNLSNTNEYLPIRDATVTISDNAGIVFELYEYSPGNYRNQNFSAVIGRTYTLNVITEGREYSAVSQMPSPLELDSVRFMNYMFYPYYISCYFKDRVNIEDYLLFRIFLNGVFTENYLYQDKYSDGQNITLDKFKFFANHGDDVTIQVISLDKNVYKYFSMLLDEDNFIDLGNLGEGEASDLFPALSFNPTTNLTNNALGYFSAQAITTYRLVVP
ncbi:MAG: hypothetical protein A2V66_07470 [Ignavibacteria bacterium RBG_13_36_8]|nr:MAG: hypothetical protein A2V66_07470 [Ignavibacteria bacterium RBG_13_36_8]